MTVGFKKITEEGYEKVKEWMMELTRKIAKSYRKDGSSVSETDKAFLNYS
jgi:hypothetical protein